MNIITLSHKATTSEAFGGINKVVVDGISDNMVSLFKSGKYCSMNTIDTSTMVYCVINFVSEAFPLQDGTTCDVQISSSGELVFKAQYLICMQEKTDWYWEQKNQQQVIIISTRTILHTCIDVMTLKMFMIFPEVFATKNNQNRLYKDILYV